MPLFDAYMFVDWSARNQPSPRERRRDAIWIGDGSRESALVEETYCRTRAGATERVLERLRRRADEGHRVLVGFDFSYGYPRGFAAATGWTGMGTAWRYVWDVLSSLLADKPDNRSNRFKVAAVLNQVVGAPPGPFWGVPAGQDQPGLLEPRRPSFPFQYPRATAGLPCRRLAEMRLRVKESWQLLGAGSVGSQALTGIPRVRYLRDYPDLVAISRVWPFETDFHSDVTPGAGPWIVHAEIWPGTVDAAVRAHRSEMGVIRDRVQVREMVCWARAADEQGALARYFARPAALSDEEVRVCLEEEGWILGIEPA